VTDTCNGSDNDSEVVWERSRGGGNNDDEVVDWMFEVPSNLADLCFLLFLSCLVSHV